MLDRKKTTKPSNFSHLFRFVVLIAATVAGAGQGFAQAPPATKPNFILVFIDDMGYGDLGCYGGTRAPTPRIDQMAAEGVRMTSFYASPSCSPARASVLSGCYPQRVSIPRVLFPSDNVGINPEEELVSEVLKARGYATAAFGKWHLGHLPEFLPPRHGFDEYFGIPYSNDMAPLNAAKAKQFPSLPLIEGEKSVELDPDQNLFTQQLTDRTVDFIERHQDQPFFVYLPHIMVHVPLGAGEKFRGKNGKDFYADVLMELDHSMGQILDALKRLNLDESTLVCFTSDNGPWLPFGNHAGTAGPLREGKGTMWEGGVREPCIFRWPGKIPAGQVCDHIGTTMDILPTFAHLASAALPQKRIDGVNLWPLLAGGETAKQPVRDEYYYYNHHALGAVRSGPWKLVFPHPYRHFQGPAGNDGESAGYVHGETPLSLYNLHDDIGETKNVADQHPDVVERLTALAEQARADLGDALTKRTGAGIRPAGVVKK